MLYITGVHWVVLLRPVAVGALFGIPGVALLIASAARKVDPPGVWNIVGLVLLLLGVVSVIAGVVAKEATEMAVTNRRVLVKVGFVNRKSYEILLPKIESIGIEEGLLGRLLGYGSVVVRGIGGTPEPFQNVRNPAEFRRQVQGQVDASPTNAA